jgi:hypothetical protein
MEFLSAGYAHDACEKKCWHDRVMTVITFFYKKGQVMFIKRYVMLTYI